MKPITKETEDLMDAWLGGRAEPPTETARHACLKANELHATLRQGLPVIQDLEAKLERARNERLMVQGAFNSRMHDVREAAEAAIAAGATAPAAQDKAIPIDAKRGAGAKNGKPRDERPQA